MKTLLEMTQDILSSMDSDEVNSIADTVEATQVAKVIRDSFEYLSSTSDLPVQHNVFKLDASGDNTKPALMTRPDHVLEIDYIKYDKRLVVTDDTTFDEVHYLPLEQFLELTLGLKESSTNVSSMDVLINGQSFQFKYFNDRHPTYFTTTDDRNLIFDAFDSGIDTTLQSSKTLGYGKLMSEFLLEDTFVPNLDPEQFQLLFNEAKTQANLEVKQLENRLSNDRKKKSFIHTQRTKHSNNAREAGINRTYNYGRNGAGLRGRNSVYRKRQTTNS